MNGIKHFMTDYLGLLAYSDWLRDEGREEEAIAFVNAITEERGWSGEYDEYRRWVDLNEISSLKNDNGHGNLHAHGDGLGYGHTHGYDYGRPGTASGYGDGYGSGDGEEGHLY